MIEPNAPYRSRRRLWSILIAVGTTLVVAGVVARHNHIEARWARVRVDAAAALSAYEAQDDARPPLYGPAVPGNAYDGYGRARSLAASATPKGDDLALLLDDAAARPDLSAWQSALAALHEAARSDRAKSPADVRMGFELPLVDVQATMDLVRAACLDGRNQIHAEHAREGLHRLLDALTLATDLTNSMVLIEQLVGMANLQSLITVGLDDATLDRLADDDLRLLAAALQRADERVPTTASPSGDALLCGQQLRRSELDGGDGFDLTAWRAWRYGFSVRLMVAEGYLLLREHAKTMDAAKNEPWPVREARFVAFDTELRGGGNQFLSLVGGNHKAAEEQLRIGVTHLRLLRSVVAERLGAPIQLDDPLGTGKLTRSEVDGRIRYAGVGADDGPISREARRR